MTADAPAAVAATFVERFAEGAFDEADELIHPDGPLEGTGELAAVVSLVLTDFLATPVLRSVPTEVVETTVREEGPARAIVEAGIDVAGVVATDAVVELRHDYETAGDAGLGGWRV